MTFLRLFNVMHLIYDDPLLGVLYEVRNKEHFMWRRRPSVCDLLLAAKPFAGFS